MKTGMPFRRYRPFAAVNLPDRTWPDRVVTHAPRWCSVDLRDGNQALAEPMGAEEKRAMFDLLVKIGFKEIEVGFPAASKIEFDFIRSLIENRAVPDDVTIQVLTQAREDLIRKTFDAVRGAKRVIVHLYVSTSKTQREVVLRRDRDGIVDLATRYVGLVRELAEAQPETQWILEFCPESFTQTEPDFAADACEAAIKAWRAGGVLRPVIVNLPATVEVCTPNAYADMVEWMIRRLSVTESVTVSVHPHNDRGTGIAAAEQACLAGAHRVEGTLFGNGERTGNVDLVTLALNLMSQGVDAGLDFSDLPGVVRTYERCTGMAVPRRQPYAGELAYTAFSGSHQDAIDKGLRHQEHRTDGIWDVPYLPIDPRDIGREVRFVRINSQSGKGGIAHVLRRVRDIEPPRGLITDFSAVVQRYSESVGREVSEDEVGALFDREYLDRVSPVRLLTYRSLISEDNKILVMKIKVKGKRDIVVGSGNGPIDAFMHAINRGRKEVFAVASYEECSMGTGSDSKAVAYVAVQVSGHDHVWGVGIDTDATYAAFLATLSAVNRHLKRRSD
ncbi:MAG: 2-isopropylmalate synthase [Candidatus Moranbacteria bacterium]|nr:2-isopropylmalate synthase [Candidatus Moranbacteria bacterium]